MKTSKAALLSILWEAGAEELRWAYEAPDAGPECFAFLGTEDTFSEFLFSAVEYRYYELVKLGGGLSVILGANQYARQFAARVERAKDGEQTWFYFPGITVVDDPEGNTYV